MNKLDSILDKHPKTQALKVDGFDDAVIGYDITNDKLIYSYSSIIEILMEDMTEEEAMEYFDYNIGGAYMGERTPIYKYDEDLYGEEI